VQNRYHYRSIEKESHSMLNIAVFGAGRIGKIHATNIAGELASVR